MLQILFLLKFLLLNFYIYIPSCYCLYTPGPLLLYPSLSPILTVTPQLVLSSCNWPHKGLPVICQSSLDEARIYLNFMFNLLVMRSTTQTTQNSRITYSVEGAKNSGHQGYLSLGLRPEKACFINWRCGDWKWAYRRKGESNRVEVEGAAGSRVSFH